MKEDRRHRNNKKIFECGGCGKRGRLCNAQGQMVFAETTFDINVKTHSGKVVKAGKPVTVCAECASQTEK